MTFDVPCSFIRARHPSFRTRCAIDEPLQLKGPQWTTTEQAHTDANTAGLAS